MYDLHTPCFRPEPSDNRAAVQPAVVTPRRPSAARATRCLLLLLSLPAWAAEPASVTFIAVPVYETWGSRQFRNPQERKTPFYQISYTHQMKSRTEYLRKENLTAVRAEVANFKRFRKLVDQWADAALKLSQIKTRLGLHSSES